MSYEKKFIPPPRHSNTPFPLANGEVLLECPYDKNHKFLEMKATTHLMKCNRQHIKSRSMRNLPPEFKICEYSMVHHIRSELMDTHLLDCPARLERIQAIRDIDFSAAPKLTPAESPQQNRRPQERSPRKKYGAYGEDDDDDDMVEGMEEDEWESRHEGRKYDYAVRQKQLIKTRQPIGLTKSEKKERMQKIVQSRDPKLQDTSDEWK